MSTCTHTRRGGIWPHYTLERVDLLPLLLLSKRLILLIVPFELCHEYMHTHNEREREEGMTLLHT